MQVLQEVAAARHILIMCGSTEIDGYAFFLGVESLKGFYKDLPDLQSLIPSVTYLIRGAIFRPKYATSRSGAATLDICPLGELIDMYHTRKATMRRDKVYALLGMSSDDVSKLSPNYKDPWEELLERLVKFLLGEKVSVETWVDREMAVIESKGCILGQVFLVESGNARQTVTFKNTPGQPRYIENRGARWTLRASAKSIQRDDLVCLLEGASKPSIIRLCKDHFAVIMITATPEEIETESGSVRAPGLFQSTTIFPRDFLLVWDWEQPPEESQDRKEYETLMKPNGQGPEHSKTALDGYLDKPTRLWNVALILGDLEEYKEAEEKLREAIGDCKRAVGEEHPHTLTGMDNLALIYKKKRQWKEAEELFVQVVQIRKQVQGADHPDTLSSMANLESTHRDQGHLKEAEKLKTMIHLLERREDNAQITEEEVVQIARSFDKEVMTLLLERKGDDVQVTEDVIMAAAGNEQSGEEVITLLLKQQGADIQIAEEVVILIAGMFGKEVMTLLLDRRGADVQITKEVVILIAEMFGKEVMIFLLERRGVDVQIAEEVVILIARMFGKEVMTLLLDRRGADVQITEKVVILVVGMFGKEVITLLLDRRGADVQITEDVVQAAAGNKRNGKEVMTLLLNQRGVDVQITEGVVMAAAGNERSGEEVMTLLLNQRGVDIQITEGVVMAAAGNWGSGKEVITLLLKRRGVDVQITEGVVMAAAGNRRSGNKVITLLLERREITEGEVMAAAGNWRSGKKVITLLLKRLYVWIKRA